MPHGNPKVLIAARIDKDVIAAVRERTSNLTDTVEQGLRLWLDRQQRREERRLSPVKTRRSAAKG
jgi:uncharacterized protein (DUF4415 family)